MMRSPIHAVLPRRVHELLSQILLKADMVSAARKDRASVFSEIYRRRKWGVGPTAFFSGSGSEDVSSQQYIAYARRFIADNDIKSVVDLGCGDFQVGRQIIGDDVEYHGCDVVAELIEFNNARYGGSNVRFSRRDIVTDPLPDGELCLVRQVFQHLPNVDIKRVLNKLDKFRFVLVTDEQIKGDDGFANKDINAFHGTRRLFGQGVKLERPPFAEAVKVVLECDHPGTYGAQYQAYLRTVLIDDAARRWPGR
jgi:hypothetical protein